MLAQVIVSPNASPTLSNGGWVYDMAILLVALGVLITLMVIFGYMRFAPRFQRDEGQRPTVKAPRIQPGREAPRRPVVITGAPVVVPAPVPVGAAVAAPTPAAPAPAPAAPAPAPAPAAPAPAEAAAAPAAEAAAPAPAAEAAAPAAEAAAPAPAAEAAAPAAEAAAPAPAAEAAAPAPAAEAAPAAAPTPAPAPAEHKEVPLDQETFERVLAELLEKGTDRRVAEGQARRAAMIAARKKAEG